MTTAELTWLCHDVTNHLRPTNEQVSDFCYLTANLSQMFVGLCWLDFIFRCHQKGPFAAQNSACLAITCPHGPKPGSEEAIAPMTCTRCTQRHVEFASIEDWRCPMFSYVQLAKKAGQKVESFEASQFSFLLLAKKSKKLLILSLLKV